MCTLNVFCASGGGARGAFQGGVLEALSEARIELHGLVGVSTGSIQSGYLSLAAPGLDEQTARVRSLKELWFGLEDDSDVYDKPFLGPVSLLLGSPSLFGLRPLRRVLEAHLREAPRRPVRLGVVDLASGTFEPRDPRTAEELRAAIIASSSIPFAFPSYAGALVDAGVREIAPLDLAFELASDMMALPGAAWDSVHVFLALASPRRTTDLPLYLPGGIRAQIDVIQPDAAPYSTLEFRPDRIRALWAQGRAKARQMLASWRPDPAPRSRHRFDEARREPSRAGVDA